MIIRRVKSREALRRDDGTEPANDRRSIQVSDEALEKRARNLLTGRGLDAGRCQPQ
jgi:hypothetical protein